jgi:hypothetical protein
MLRIVRVWLPNFENPRNFFIEEKPNNTNLSQICKMCHGLGYSQDYLSPIVQLSWFLVRDMFCDTYYVQLEMNLKNPREVFIYNEIIYKTLSHFIKICFYQ